MILYLTFNDLPSGIFSSQVIDVVKFINTDLKIDIKLVSFISLRNYSENKKKILSEFPGAIILPMFPGVHRWKYNSFLLKKACKYLKPSVIIGRSVLATQLAMRTGVKKIIYDGRGAITAEWKEYNVVNNPELLNTIEQLEQKAIINSFYRIAVSGKLVDHWKEKFGYNLVDHVVIPCTLNKAFEIITLSNQLISEARNKLGLSPHDLVFIYSGSVAGWQSFELLYQFIKPILKSSNDKKLVFLSSIDKNISKLISEFPEKVVCKKVNPAEVPFYLTAGDYGLLIREESTTNKVASPVKFAEYISCGLKVIISDNLGDYSELVRQNNLGYNYQDFNAKEKPTFVEKQTIRQFAVSRFTKKNYTSAYQKIVSI